MKLREYVSSEIQSIPEEHSNVLKGEIPFNTIVESIVEQFNEFNEFNRIISDKTNWFDTMNQQLQLSREINNSTFDEFEIDDNESINQMDDLFTDIVIGLMDSIGVDLSQVDDPYRLAYLLYTNFMLTDQRQAFFNYVVDFNVQSAGLETDLAIAHGWMMEDKPEQMYIACSEMFDGKQELNYVESFIESCGLTDIAGWVVDGFLPVNILYQLFLRFYNIDTVFVEYYRYQKSKSRQGDA